MSLTSSVGPTYVLRQHVSASSLQLSPALLRACDRCRRRKKKCNGLNPCYDCEKSLILCTYHAVPQRKGPKRGKRAPSLLSPPELDIFQPTPPSLFSPTSDHLNLAEGTSLYLSPTSSEGTTCIDHGFSTPRDLDQFWSSPVSKSVTTGKPEFSVYHSEVDVLPAAEVVPANSPRPRDETQGLTRTCFWPHLQYFFENLYTIFPVLDRKKFFDDFLIENDSDDSLPPKESALLAALSATVAAQVNLPTFKQSIAATCDLHKPNEHHSQLSADFWVLHCFESRKKFPYIEQIDEYSVLTSFFLFYHYGNFNESRLAWYYLREAIHFALMLRLNQSKTYEGIASEEAQRLRRIYWLLFVTERAYALQHQSYTILQPCIDVPKMFESENPRLICGFLLLINVFKSVDQHEVSREQSLEPDLALTDSKNLSADFFPTKELIETQRVDIEVTRQWLRVLRWRTFRDNRSANGQMLLFHAHKISSAILGTITSAEPRSLELHGIGMEQKLFDTACMLSDVLEHIPRISSSDFSTTHNMLLSFMQLLVSFRNQESRYMQPLLKRAKQSLEGGLGVPLPIGFDFTATSDRDCDAACPSEAEQSL